MADDYLHDLDPAFADNAARLSAKFDELTRDIDAGPDSEWAGTTVVYGPLKGWSKAPFFEAAAGLSGQDLGLIESLYDVVTDVWYHCGDHAHEFQSGMAHALTDWDGPAALGCASYVGSVVDFTTREQICLASLAEALATYAGVIEQARDNLNRLMGACVDGWAQAGHQGELAGIGVTITILTQAASVAFAGAAGSIGLPTWGNALTAITGAMINNTLSLSGRSTDIAHQFLAGSRDLAAHTIDAIETKAATALQQVHEHLPSVPVIPGGIDDKKSFYPTGGQPERRTADHNSPINKTLGK